MNNRKKIGEIGFGQPLVPKGPYLRKAVNDKSGKPLPLGPTLDNKPNNALRSLPKPKFEEGSIMQRPVVKKQLTTPGSSKPATTSTTSSTTSTTSEPTTTTTTIGTTSTTPSNTTMPRRRRNGNQSSGSNSGSNSYQRGNNSNNKIDNTNVTSTSSEYNAVKQERGIFFPLSEANKIDFAVPVRSPFHFITDLPNFGPSYDPSTTNFKGEFSSSLHINLSNFSLRFYNIGTTGDNASAFYKTLLTIFDRVSDDVFRDARSNTVSVWTFTNFVNYLYNVCRALEWITTLDSILAYEARDGVMNKGLMKLKDTFNSSKILVLRSDLRQNLLGKVFPPKFSEMIRWFYQSYQTSELKYSPCYRYLPDELFVTKIASVDDLESSINTMIANMTGSTNAQIGGALSKLYPNWIIKDIPGGYHDSIYDIHHSEVMVNDPIIFVDRKASTSTPCIYPNPSETNVDIPYYVREMPSDGNGFPHILTCFHKCTTNSYNWSTNDIVRTNSGIRYIPNTAPTTAVNALKTNKFFYNPEDNTMQPRLYNAWSTLADYSAHKAISDSSTVNATAVSIAPRGYGRVYYNNID